MTDRPTESTGSRRASNPGDAEPEPVDTATWPRKSSSEESETERTNVAGMPRVTDETPDATQEKPTLAAAARSKFEGAKQAVTNVAQGATSGRGDDTRPTRSRGPRRARLRLTRIDPWSVMKTSFLLSIAFAVVTVVAVGMVWQVLGAAGVWDSINDTVQSGIGGDDVSSFQVQDYVGTSRVLGFTMLVAAIDVVLITAAATLTAFLYNMAAALLGGVEVTLSEDVD